MPGLREKIVKPMQMNLRRLTSRETRNILERGLAREEIVVLKQPASHTANVVVRGSRTVESKQVHGLVDARAKVYTNAQRGVNIRDYGEFAVDSVVLRGEG